MQLRKKENQFINLANIMQKIKLNYINRTSWAEEKCIAAATISASGPLIMGDLAFFLSIFSPSQYAQKRKLAKDLQIEVSPRLSFLSLLILLTEKDQSGSIRFWTEKLIMGSPTHSDRNSTWRKQNSIHI